MCRTQLPGFSSALSPVSTSPRLSFTFTGFLITCTITFLSYKPLHALVPIWTPPPLYFTTPIPQIGSLRTQVCSPSYTSLQTLGTKPSVWQPPDFRSLVRYLQSCIHPITNPENLPVHQSFLVLVNFLIPGRLCYYCVNVILLFALSVIIIIIIIMIISSNVYCLLSHLGAVWSGSACWIVSFRGYGNAVRRPSSFDGFILPVI